MSRYLCPECNETSSVIETRPSQRRLRRRRSCKNGHRFSTIEVPLTAEQQLVELLDWGFKNGSPDDETLDYLKSEMKRILAGMPEEEDLA